MEKNRQKYLEKKSDSSFYCPLPKFDDCIYGSVKSIKKTVIDQGFV